MRQAAVKRPRLIIGQEQNGVRLPEVIQYFTQTSRLAPGSIITGVFQEMPGERRIPFSNGRIQIKPGQSPEMAAPSGFILGRPEVGPESMNGHRLSIFNLTSHTHAVKARPGVKFGAIGDGIVSMAASTPLPPGGIFADGKNGGNTLSIGPFGSVEILANNGRWIIIGGRHTELG